MKTFIAFVLIVIGLGEVDGQIVDTQFGKVQGSINGGTYQFLGIPFAKLLPRDSVRAQR